MVAKQIVKSVVNVIFVTIMLLLFIFSLFYSCQIDQYSYARLIEVHSPLKYSLLTALLCVALIAILMIGSKLQITINQKRILMICGFVVSVIGICWMLFNDSTPRYDQQTLFEEAQKIAGYNLEPYDAQYMIAFKRQRFVVLLMATGMKIFGNNYLGFRLLNLVGAVLLYVGVCLAVRRIEKDKVVNTFTMIMVAIFYPIVVYISFLYGTLWSATASVWGFYNVIVWSQGHKTKNAVAIPIWFAIAAAMHQSALVAVVAASIFLCLYGNDTECSDGTSIIWDRLQKYAIVLITIIAIVLWGKMTDCVYEGITGIQKGDSLPPLATVAMGITAETEDGGPGAQDGTFFTIYQENDFDASKTNEAAITKIKKAASEYIHGERSWEFFLEKTKYQWLDPTWGSRKTIMTNWEEPFNSETFMTFYNSSIRGVIYKASNIVMIAMYFSALVFGIYSVFAKSIAKEHFLIQIFVCGGFAFSLIWESLSRYCFPYFIWILIEGICGINLMSKKSMELLEKVRTGKFLREE